MIELKGKRALVTGASGGIGSAIVSQLKQAHALVAAADQTESKTRADAFLKGDLTQAAYANQLPQLASEALGGLDIVINNAGIIRRGTVPDTSDEDFNISMEVNVKAPFRISRATIPLFLENEGGAIVNIASCWGVHAGPSHAVYCMSKAALASLTQCMALDHAHQGIRINAVCPNEVDTPMLRSGFEHRGLDPASAIADLDASVPLGRIAQPRDIADVVLFLISSQARYICGELIEVNGGKPVK